MHLNHLADPWNEPDNHPPPNGYCILFKTVAKVLRKLDPSHSIRLSGPCAGHGNDNRFLFNFLDCVYDNSTGGGIGFIDLLTWHEWVVGMTYPTLDRRVQDVRDYMMQKVGLA